MRTFIVACIIPLGVLAAERPDMLIADFEGKTYGEWKATGTAFGDRPVRGTLPDQMPVSGFLGEGLVNSFAGGDGSRGTLTSPAFKVERRYINFLIGGGKHDGKTCMNLLIDGKSVRTATGPNDRPGGSEELAWHAWDVGEFAGKMAVLQIVDDATGGWGHVNIDHIVLSDRSKEAREMSRELAVEDRYLHLPVKNGAPKRRLTFAVAGKPVREFEIELAEGKPDFHVFADMSAFRGHKLTVTARLPADSQALGTIVASNDLPAKESLYREKLRPLFHFTARRGWLNDPNGLVFDGEVWHLFFQHNPFGKEWGNMHWGHAISRDLVHWSEQPIALYQRSLNDMAFSGSAVLDKNNTSGFGTTRLPPLVLAYTSTGRGECLAYSNDKGRTWTEYEKNPVVKHVGRDPKIVWFEPGKHWVMAVYDEPKGKQRIAFYTSPDLKSWTYQSSIDDFFECPDLFEAEVFGAKDVKKWILYGADGKYIVGTFDGKKFTKESGKHQTWYGNFYAAQTFDNAPNGDRIQIGWAQGVTFPGMPFNQQMTVPVNLLLSETPDGPRLLANPVSDINRLLLERRGQDDVMLGKEPATLVKDLDAARIRLEFKPPADGVLSLSLRGLPIVYDAARSTLTCGKVTAPLKLQEGKIVLTILLDRGSVEVFGNSGSVALSMAHVAPAQDTALTARGAGLTLQLAWWPMRSAWK